MMDNINTYNFVVQEYLSLAIRKILQLLQGGKLSNFCFYITFDKNHENNSFPEDVNEEIVTIVLQNRFWDLEVDEDGFEVTVEINQKKERIFVCFDSVLLFTDQTANFILDFRGIRNEENEENEDSSGIIFVELP